MYMSVRLQRLPDWCKPIVFVDMNSIEPFYTILSKGKLFIVVRRVDESNLLVVHKARYEQDYNGIKITRIINTYSPREVVSSTSILTHDPRYGVSIPLYNTQADKGAIVCSHREASHQYICKLRKDIHHFNIVSEFKRKVGINIYFTGSLLLGYALRSSDIDLVVAGYKSACKIIDILSELLHDGIVKPLTPRELREWAMREACSRGLSVADIVKLYSPYSRFKFMNITFSLSYYEPHYRSQPERRIFVIDSNDVVKDECIIEDYYPQVLDYPHIARVVTCKRLKNLDYIVSFDGIYFATMFTKNKIQVRGVKGQLIDSVNRERILVAGIREAVTLITPL